MRSWWLAMAISGLGVVPVAAKDAAAPLCAYDEKTPVEPKSFAREFFPTAGLAELAGLVACLVSPDPKVRDDFAFTALSNGLRADLLSPELIRAAMGQALTIVADPSPDRVGVRKPFAILLLSEIARADRINRVLTEAELTRLVTVGTDYMAALDDYRGYEAGVGWRHGVAHASDLFLQLALNPRLTRASAQLILAAIAPQIAPAASPFYIHGEPARLARPVLFLAKTDLVDSDEWAAWFASLKPDAAARWQEPFGTQEGLAAAHNSGAFAREIYLQATQSHDEKTKRLAPLSLALINALP